MNATPEKLREALLMVLDRNRTQFGLSASALAFQVRQLSILASDAEITQELEYLAGRSVKPLVMELNPEINRRIRVWKITEDGIDYCDQHNL